MAEGGVSGKALGVALAGAILTYSAVKGHKVSTTIRDLIAGKDPTKNETVDYPVNPGDPSQGGMFLDPSNPSTNTTPQAPTVHGKIATSAIYQYAVGAGFNPIAAVIMTAIALAESGGDPNSLNNTPATGDLSYGLWQINMINNLGPARRARWGLQSNDQLFDPATNARAAYDISHGGTVFTDWTTFTSGAYRKYLTQAQAASHG